MRWSTEVRDWKRHFALFPISVRSWKTGKDETIWLGWCWRRFNGDHYEVSFTDPTPSDQQHPGAEQ